MTSAPSVTVSSLMEINSLNSEKLPGALVPSARIRSVTLIDRLSKLSVLLPKQRMQRVKLRVCKVPAESLCFEVNEIAVGKQAAKRN